VARFVDLDGNGHHSNGDGPSEFARLWQSLFGEQGLRTEKA